MTTPAIVLTNAGMAKVAAAVAAGSTVQVTQIAFGDGGGAPVTVNRARTALIGEQWRGAIDSVVTDVGNPSLRGLVYTLPASTGGYRVREVGLFDGAGVMIAHGGVPDFDKPAPGSAFAQVVTGTIWIHVTDADTLEIVVNISDGVPQVRTLAGGHGIAPIGDLSQDRTVELELTDLALLPDIPDTLSFPVHDTAGSSLIERHRRVSLQQLDARWLRQPEGASTLTGGLGVAPIGQLDEDRMVSLDLTELASRTRIAASLSFVAVRGAGATPADKHQRVTLRTMERHFRTGRRERLYFSQLG
jgi:hypothetical protein